MKSWKVNGLWLCVLAMAITLIVSCQNDNDDDDDSGANADDDSADDDSPTDDDTQGSTDDDTNVEACEDNIPPELLSIQYVLNGEIVEPPVVAVWPDVVSLLIEYRDEDCNMVGGYYGVLYTGDGENEGRINWFEDSVACSTEDGEPYQAELNLYWFSYPHTPPINFFIHDDCIYTGMSNEIELQIEWTESR